MSEETEEEKKKKKKSTKIITGIIVSAGLIGATIAGGMTAIAETEGEKEEEEEKNNKKGNGSPSEKSSVIDNRQNLAVIFKDKTNLQLKSEDSLKMISLETIKEVIKERVIENNPQLNLIKEKITLSDLKYGDKKIKPFTLTVEMTYDDPLVMESVTLNIIYKK